MSQVILYTRQAIPSLNQPEISPATVWKGIRHEDIRLPITDFLWKSLQGALKCGTYWDNIPDLAHRALCRNCRCTDSPEHILLQCEEPGQRTVWTLAKNIWQRKGLPWPQLTLPVILRASTWHWNNNLDPVTADGAARLWRIIITESTYLIWKLRCERVIGHAEETEWTHSVQAITNRWTYAINARLTLDRAMTRAKPPQKRLIAKRVLATWSKTLEKETELPENWYSTTRVLVGISTAIYARGTQVDESHTAPS